MIPSTPDNLAPLLATALNQARSATCITTAQLDVPGPQIVYVNPAYCEMVGRTADEVLGLTPRIMQGPLTSRAVLDRLRSDLEEGRSFRGETVNYRKDGKPFLISWRVDPVRDADGVTTHYVATQQDITRLRQAERLLATEQAIDRSVSTVLHSPGPLATNLAKLAEDVSSAVGHLVDYGQVALACCIRLGRVEHEFHAGDHGIAVDVLDTVRSGGGTVVWGADGDQRWLGCSLASAQNGIDGAVVVGGLSLAEAEFIDAVGLERAVECGRRAFESLAEYERTRHMAVTLQEVLLPLNLPEVEGLRLAACYEPGAFAAKVGGDWYDVVDVDDRVHLVVGDMTGSGIRAAADMGRLRLLIRVVLRQGLDAPEALSVANRFCAEEGVLATVLTLTLDSNSPLVSAVSAGHLPFVVRSGLSARAIEVESGALLGIGGEESYPVNTVELAQGDIAVMFTDGLVERRGETIDAGLARLVEAVRTLPAQVDTLCERLIEDRLAEGVDDDIAVIAIQRHRVGGESRSG